MFAEALSKEKSNALKYEPLPGWKKRPFLGQRRNLNVPRDQ
jgi:hypothetical protein